VSSTGGLVGLEQNLFERQFYRREFILFPTRARSAGNRAAASLEGRHFFAFFLFAVEKKEGRHQAKNKLAHATRIKQGAKKPLAFICLRKLNYFLATLVVQ